MERPSLKAIKDKEVLAYIDHLENQLKSPFADSYTAIKKIVDDGNEQLRGKKFDIFNAESETEAKMVSNFLDRQQKYAEQMVYFKSKMTPQERKDVESKMIEEAGLAERIALSETNRK